MVRPRKFRNVGHWPDVTYFKPRAVPLRELLEVNLTVDELEAMRLANLERLSQAEAAVRMQIHQSTFNRTLAKAREKVTSALVDGKAIRIYGGDYRMPGRNGRGPRAQGAGRGGMGFAEGGPKGFCACTHCDYQTVHARGSPCNEVRCPRCGSPMTRG